MNNDLKKLIVRSFDPFAKNNGFPFRKTNMWYTVRDGIMLSIGFEFTSCQARALYCIQPLYEYCDHIVLEYGDTVSHQCAVRGLKVDPYLLYYDLPLTTVASNLQNVISFFLSYVIPVFGNVQTADNIIPIYREKSFFFTQPVNVLKLFAYTLAYSGDYNLASVYFQKYIDEFSKQNTLSSVILNESLYIMDLLKANPDSVHDFLIRNINRSVEALKLKLG